MRDSNEVSVSDKQNVIFYSPSHTRYSERGNRVHFSIGQLHDRKFQFLYCRDQNFLYEVTILILHHNLWIIWSKNFYHQLFWIRRICESKPFLWSMVDHQKKQGQVSSDGRIKSMMIPRTFCHRIWINYQTRPSQDVDVLFDGKDYPWDACKLKAVTVIQLILIITYYVMIIWARAVFFNLKRAGNRNKNYSFKMSMFNM